MPPLRRPGAGVGACSARGGVIKATVTRGDERGAGRGAPRAQAPREVPEASRAVLQKALLAALGADAVWLADGGEGLCAEVERELLRTAAEDDAGRRYARRARQDQRRRVDASFVLQGGCFSSNAIESNFFFLVCVQLQGEYSCVSPQPSFLILKVASLDRSSYKSTRAKCSADSEMLQAIRTAGAGAVRGAEEKRRFTLEAGGARAQRRGTCGAGG